MDGGWLKRGGRRPNHERLSILFAVRRHLDRRFASNPKPNLRIDLIGRWALHILESAASIRRERRTREFKQERQTMSDCTHDTFSSRTCERGTPCCDVRHESGTPRTDAQVFTAEAVKGSNANTSRPQPVVMADFSRNLERELNAAKDKLATVYRLVELAEQINASKTDAEVAASAEFNEAVAYTENEMLQEQLNAANARIKELETLIEDLLKANEKT